MSTPIESMRSLFTESEEALRKAKEELEKDKEELDKDKDAIDKAKKFLLQDVNYQRLKNKALLVQYATDPDDGYTQKEAREVKALSQQQISDIATSFFLSAGLDYKGQNQSCYQADGLQGGVDVQFDFARLLTGVFSAEVNAGVSTAVLLKKILIAQVGPLSIASDTALYNVPKPVMINLCEGVCFTGTAKAGVFAGVAVEAGFDLGLTVAGVDASVVVKAEARGGATADAALSGTYFYAEDSKSKGFERNNNAVRQELANLLEYKIISETITEKGKNLKLHRIKPTIITSILISSTDGNTNLNIATNAGASVKCALINASADATANAMTGGSYKKINVRYQSAYTSDQPIDISDRSNERLKSRINVAMTQYGEQHQGWTSIFRNQSNASKVAYDSLSTMDPDMRVKAVAYLLGFSQDKPTGLTNTPLKTGSSFYEALRNAYKEAFVVMTQDSRIIYQQYQYNANASLNAKFGKQDIVDSTTSKKFCYNRMSYKTVTVFWYSQNKIHPYLQIPRAPSATKADHTIRTKALKGSGVSFGGSFLLGDLKEALEYNPTNLLELISNIPDESNEQFTPENLGELRLINSDIGDEQERIDHQPMQMAIKKALEDFDKNYLQTSWYAQKPYAAKTLEEIIARGEPVGPAVAWLTNQEIRDNSKDKFYDVIFSGKQKGYKDNPTPTKQKFFSFLTKAYQEGMSEQQKSESTIDAANKKIRDMKTTNKVNEDYNATLLDKRDKQEKDRQLKLKAQEEANKRIRDMKSLNSLNEDINADISTYNNQNKHNSEYLKSVAESLNITEDQLKAFFGKDSDSSKSQKTAFNSKKCLGMILEHETAFPGLESIILEASFKLEPNITLTCSLIKQDIWKRITGYKSSTENEELIELSPNTAKEMLEQFEIQPKKLNAIRMRFRIQDLHNDEKILFKLGFKMLGTGAKIELKGLEQAGSEGIIDLHTAWFDDTGNILDSSLLPQQHYENGVPQVALFCQ
jgi:hypothetical protein